MISRRWHYSTSFLLLWLDRAESLLKLGTCIFKREKHFHLYLLYQGWTTARYALPASTYSSEVQWTYFQVCGWIWFSCMLCRGTFFLVVDVQLVVNINVEKNRMTHTSMMLISLLYSAGISVIWILFLSILSHQSYRPSSLFFFFFPLLENFK